MCSKPNENPCNICLRNNEKLINTYEVDENNVKWSSKLIFCVPEVKWNNTCIICSNCAEHLNIACSFRKLCLESHQSHVQLSHLEAIANKDNSGTTESNYNNESGCCTCYICNSVFLTKAALVEHLQSHVISQSNNHEISHGSCISKISKNHNSAEIPTKQNLTIENHLEIEINEEDVELEDNNCFSEEDSKTKEDDGDFESDSSDNERNNCNISISNSAIDNCKIRSKTEKRSISHRNNKFNCEECNDYFASSKKLVNHSRVVHGPDSSSVKPFACDKCESRFSSSSNLQQHKKYHIGNRNHICTFCGKGFITKNDLNVHEKQHLNKREYKCLNCPKNFNTHKDLRTHKLVVHTDAIFWNYACRFCHKRFPIKSNLDQHVRRHTGEKRFGCHICEKRFVDKCVLQKHIKSHSNIRAFKCEYCNKEYKEERILEIHKTKIHGVGNAKVPVREKKHFCHICPKSYFAKNKLTRHMFSHTGEKPYNCHICEKKFTDKSYVKQHLKTTHNINMINENS